MGIIYYNIKMGGKTMSTSKKIHMIVSILAAAGVFGICSVISNNEALPLWLRIVVEVLSVTNLICVIIFNQDLRKQTEKK